MGRMFQIYNNFLGLSSKYGNKEVLYEGLKAEDPSAIHFLYAKIFTFVTRLGQENKLTDQHIEELLNDAITILIQKIRNEEYSYHGNSPSTYAIEIAKLNVNNYRRQMNHHKTDDFSQAIIHEVPASNNHNDDLEQVEYYLSRLDPICQKLIRLKYLDEWKDAEIIENNFTHYTTVDSLKNQRKKCFGKLVNMAKAI